MYSKEEESFAISFIFSFRFGKKSLLLNSKGNNGTPYPKNMENSKKIFLFLFPDCLRQLPRG